MKSLCIGSGKSRHDSRLKREINQHSHHLLPSSSSEHAPSDGCCSSIFQFLGIIVYLTVSATSLDVISLLLLLVWLTEEPTPLPKEATVWMPLIACCGSANRWKKWGFFVDFCLWLACIGLLRECFGGALKSCVVGYIMDPLEQYVNLALL